MEQRAAQERERKAVPEHLPFNEGLKWITNQKKPERARKMFARALAFYLSAADIEEFFAKHADKGPVRVPKDDEEREGIRLALAMGQYGGFHAPGIDDQPIVLRTRAAAS
jgi:hypothetical protein